MTGPKDALRIEHLDGPQRGQVDVIEPPGGSLGRGPCTVVVEDRNVSSVHVKFSWRSGTWWVADAGSSNGTRLNQQRVTTDTPLPDQAVLEVGGAVRLRVTLPVVAPRAVAAPGTPRWVLGVPLLAIAMVLVGTATWHARHVQAERAALSAELEERLAVVDPTVEDPALRALLERLQRVDVPVVKTGEPLFDHVVQMSRQLTGSVREEVPRVFLDRVEAEVLDLIRGRQTYCSWRRMRDELVPILQQELPPAEDERANMLVYIPWIESRFQPDACSTASARGMWQFMDFSARRYGLRVDEERDERCDWRKATVAAAAYFHDAFALCGPEYPLLAIAAYNTKPERACAIASMTKIRQEDRDFLAFVIEGYLPAETMRYVPRFVAASFIGEHPEEAVALARGRRPALRVSLDCPTEPPVPPSAPCATPPSTCIRR